LDRELSRHRSRLLQDHTKEADISQPTDLTIIPLILSSGERLPCLVYSATWLPVKLPTRWIMCHRRLHAQPSTLRDNLYAISKLYVWAEHKAGIDLEPLLLRGKTLQPRQLETLAAYLRESSPARGQRVVSPNTFNKALYAIEDFLLWTLDYTYSAQPGTDLQGHQMTRMQLTTTLRSLRYPAHSSRRHQPLSDTEVATVRKVLTPQPDHMGNWIFPHTFGPTNALRNWLMVEMALELGLRIGELLKLRLDSLPRGSQSLLLVRRHPDDPFDTRRHEPAVKTAERGLPLSEPLRAALRAYVTGNSPLGRVMGRSPYLFVTRTGKPLSRGRANDIVETVSHASGIHPLSWHRFRHTWAERMATYLLEVPNGIDQLMYLGGWTNPQSPLRYMQQAVAKHAQAHLEAWHRSLYSDKRTDE
jgi:integrase